MGSGSGVKPEENDSISNVYEGIVKIPYGFYREKWPQEFLQRLAIVAKNPNVLRKAAEERYFKVEENILGDMELVKRNTLFDLKMQFNQKEILLLVRTENPKVLLDINHLCFEIDELLKTGSVIEAHETMGNFQLFTVEPQIGIS